MFLSHLYISNTFRMTVLTINPNNKRKYSFYKASVQIREKIYILQSKNINKKL